MRLLSDMFSNFLRVCSKTQQGKHKTKEKHCEHLQYVFYVFITELGGRTKKQTRKTFSTMRLNAL